MGQNKVTDEFVKVDSCKKKHRQSLNGNNFWEKDQDVKYVAIIIYTRKILQLDDQKNQDFYFIRLLNMKQMLYNPLQ